MAAGGMALSELDGALPVVIDLSLNNGLSAGMCLEIVAAQQDANVRICFCVLACSFVRRTVLWGCVCMIRYVFQAMDGTFSRVASSVMLLTRISGG